MVGKRAELPSLHHRKESRAILECKTRSQQPATYWLASDVYGAGDFGWMYNSTGETGLATRLDLGPWIAGTSSGDPTPAFRINGTSAAVLEPPTLALVGIGLVVLWGYSRFKNRV